MERKATAINVPKVAPIVLVMKLRGDATKTPKLMTIEPSKWFIPYTSRKVLTNDDYSLNQFIINVTNLDLDNYLNMRLCNLERNLVYLAP